MEFLEDKNVNKSISFFVAKVKSKKKNDFFGLFANVDGEIILLSFINQNQYDKIK